MAIKNEQLCPRVSDEMFAKVVDKKGDGRWPAMRVGCGDGHRVASLVGEERLEPAAGLRNVSGGLEDDAAWQNHPPGKVNSREIHSDGDCGWLFHHGWAVVEMSVLNRLCGHNLWTDWE